MNTEKTPGQMAMEDYRKVLIPTRGIVVAAYIWETMPNDIKTAWEAAVQAARAPLQTELNECRRLNLQVVNENLCQKKRIAELENELRLNTQDYDAQKAELQIARDANANHFVIHENFLGSLHNEGFVRNLITTGQIKLPKECDDVTECARQLDEAGARIAELEGERYDQFMLWLGVETPCKSCGGAGRRAYGSTTTWRGGIGGQMITQGVCDKCWGSGDANWTWPSHREFEALRNKLEASEKAAAAMRDALKLATECSFCEECHLFTGSENQHKPDCKIGQALSTDAGKNYMPIGEVEELIRSIELVKAEYKFSAQFEDDSIGMLVNAYAAWRKNHPAKMQ